MEGSSVAERGEAEEAREEEQEESKLPPLLSERPLPVQILLAGVIPAAYGALCGWVLGVNEVAYIILATPIAILGQLAAGFEHRKPRDGALRGAIAGALFGGFILIVHELTGKEPKAELPEPEIILLAVTTVFGALFGAMGAGWRRGTEEKGFFLRFSELTVGELAGMGASLVLVGSLWLEWFKTEPGSKGKINGAAGQFTAWEVFGLLDWLLVLAATAPFILSWIIIRGHTLTWRPGEVTMIVGITAFVLILCNGVILGKPGDPDTTISMGPGWFVGAAACLGLLAAGFLRQALHTDAKKPPGVL